VRGGGMVPLSRATCCRIVPPDHLQDSFPEDIQPQSIVSVGCHVSSGSTTDNLRCEGAGASFATGFQNSARVSAAVDAYYPLGPLSCCTPAILLSNGDLWSTKRCQCEDTPHTSCDSGDGQEHLLVGFQTFRQARSHNHVPITPMRCCKTCLGEKIMDNTCADLNKCSGHGQCAFGACECYKGWGGSDCSLKGSSGGGGVTAWQLAVLIVGAVGIAVSIVVLAWHVYTIYMRSSNEDDEGEEMSNALLLRLDPDDAGSVGSEDTTDEDDEEEIPELLDGSTVEQEGEAEGVSDAGEEVEIAVEPQSEDVEVGREMVPLEVEGGEQTADECALCHSDEDGEPEDGGYGDCNICFSRPIQVVVVPCGHACMCRRCSRRVARCPICRQDVARRQRLFMGK